MIIDSSAILAILFREPEWPWLVERITEGEAPGVATPTLVESALVLTGRLGTPGKSLLARFVQESGVREIPFTAAHWSVAVDAFLRYGKGRHPAALNFGDCLTYATAALAREPLLCVGEDFAQTDLALVSR